MLEYGELCQEGFPYSIVGKESAFNAGDPGSVSGSGRSFGEGNGNPLQYFLPGESHGQRSVAGYTIHGVARVGHDLATKPPHVKKGSFANKPAPCSLMPSPVQSLLGTEALLLNCRSRQKIGTSCWVWLRGGASYLCKCWLDLNWLRLFQSFHLGQGHQGSFESKQHDRDGECM